MVDGVAMRRSSVGEIIIGSDGTDYRALLPVILDCASRSAFFPFIQRVLDNGYAGEGSIGDVGRGRDARKTPIGSALSLSRGAPCFAASAMLLSRRFARRHDLRAESARRVLSPLISYAILIGRSQPQ